MADERLRLHRFGLCAGHGDPWLLRFLGFRVQGLGFRVWGFGVQGLGVEGLGVGFRVWS